MKVGENGITEQNVKWMKLTVIPLNFKYCTGWTKPICVPMDGRLSDNQRCALGEIARTVDDNILSADRLPSFSQARGSLQSKRYTTTQGTRSNTWKSFVLIK